MGTWWLLLSLMLSFSSGSVRLPPAQIGNELKCKACSILAQGVSRVLAEERARPNQDYNLGNRIIKWDGSEAMAMAVLQPQCAYFERYQLQMHVRGAPNRALDEQKELIQRSMRNWCEITLEEHEDAMSSQMFKLADPAEFERWLCHEFLKLCGRATGFSSSEAVLKKTDPNDNTEL
eukprot:TRINITY_DN49022_c0_g1_i1.p1 TRINITY_DN49022_c0_g1~~TRINITY_DN49022_c0_g1_i1.p1  ORF type:complete len:177 (-),score=37.29 TRINITY_DN49022_c0_g1_i1:72-602(-)